MKIKFIFILSLLLVLFITGCYSDDEITIPKEWKLVKKPDTDSEKWHQANWSDDIVIRLENESITAEVGGEIIYPDNIKFVGSNTFSGKTGTFIGINHGEWGGYVMFSSIEGLEYKRLFTIFLESRR